VGQLTALPATAAGAVLLPVVVFDEVEVEVEYR
jgi:hypothetical protein